MPIQNVLLHYDWKLYIHHLFRWHQKLTMKPSVLGLIYVLLIQSAFISCWTSKEVLNRHVDKMSSTFKLDSIPPVGKNKFYFFKISLQFKSCFYYKI